MHGENIRLSSNGTTATRVASFCQGICFSNRPIEVNERVSIRFVEISSLWNGLIRFGFTTKDPATFRNSLPKFACPDLTNSGHTYAKALPEIYSQTNNVLFFYVSANGNVHFGVNGQEKGILLSNVKVNGKLWAVIDVYGNTTKIESVDSRIDLNNRCPTHPPALSAMSAISMIDLPDELAREPSPSVYSKNTLEQVEFHRTRGINVRLSSNKCIAERNSNHYSQGYVFTQNSVNIGEKMVIQVLKTDQLYTGSLAFGLTTCNPASINVTDLPDDSHKLLDRPEYWVVIKDVANSPVAGDEIAFSITETGQVQMTKNRQRPITLMHVDITQRLWAFFDLYGSTLKVKTLGTQCNASVKSVRSKQLGQHHSKSLHNVNIPYKSQSTLDQTSQYGMCCANTGKPMAAPSSQYYSNFANSIVESKPSRSHSTGKGDSLRTFGSECLVCYERPINSVLYTCGHVAMCYQCSVKQWRTSGHCPICRATIRDVIRTYCS